MTNSNDKLKYKISDNADINKPWDKDNQAWWDWYVSLAKNDVKENEIINADLYQKLQYLVMMRLFQN